MSDLNKIRSRVVPTPSKEEINKVLAKANNITEHQSINLKMPSNQGTYKGGSRFAE